MQEEITQAVIFAGGRGERLRPLTDQLPKPLAPVNGIPFLDYLLQSLIQAGMTKILLLLGYQSQKVIDRYGDSLLIELPSSKQKEKLNNGTVKVEYSVGTVEDLTGRRLLNAYPFLDPRFLLVYGDNYWPIEFQQMRELYQRKAVKAMTTVFSNKKGTGEYGAENNVEVGHDFFVKRYDKKRQSLNLTGVDIGYFIVDKSLLDPNLSGNISFEEDILTKFISQRQLIAYITDTQYFYITDLASLKRFENFVTQNNIEPIHLVSSLL